MTSVIRIIRHSFVRNLVTRNTNLRPLCSCSVLSDSSHTLRNRNSFKPYTAAYSNKRVVSPEENMSCAGEADDYWGYDDPSKWHEHFPAAAGLCQSPIDIKPDSAVYHPFQPFSFSRNYLESQVFTMKNDGHQVAARLARATEEQKKLDLYFTGGGLNGTFHFVNFHLHWGNNDRHGSEHEIDGQEFPGEAHFVHRNFDTNETAVFAFFFHVTDQREHENAEWRKYADIAAQLKAVGSSTEITFNLSHLMQVESKQFFRYIGSLTTPPCTEGVLWTVFLGSIPILEESLNELRDNVMRKVYRPVQPLNSRTVYRNYDYPKSIWNL